MLKKITIFCLAFFLLAGHFNNFEIVQQMPIDISILSIILPVIYFFFFTSRNLVLHKSFLLFFVFLLTVIGSVAYNSYDNEKLMSFLLILIVLFTVSPVLLNDKKSISLFFKSLFIVSVIICLTTLTTMEFNISGRLTLLGSNPIWLGRAISLAFLILIVALIYNKVKILPFIVLSAPLLFVLISTGSKGPFFTVLLVIVLIYSRNIFSYIKQRKVIQRFFALAFFGTPIAVIVYYLLPNNTFDRLFNFNQEGSVDVRQELYRTSFNIIKDNPSGIGIGNFGEYTYLKNEYPHNLLLEVFVELGWIPGLTLALLIFFAFIGITRMPKGFHKDLTLSLFLIGFLNSMISGDMTSPKELYLLIPIGLNLFLANEHTLKSSIKNTVHV